MKVKFTLLLLFPLFAGAQKVALIDRDLRKPIVYVPSIQMKHMEQGYFLLTDDNIKNVIDTIQMYRSLISEGDRIPENKKSVIAGNTYFNASGKSGDYSLVIDTKVSKMGTYYVLATKKKSRKENLEAIDNFVAYLNNNTH